MINEIGLVQRFFKERLAANNNAPVIEDEDLPQKQRLPKPRLGPTGKITSPRKRLQKEAGPGKGHPKKKMRLIEGQGWVKTTDLLEQEKQKDKKPAEEKKKEQTQASQQLPEKGSKLKHSTSAMDLDNTPPTGPKINGEAAPRGGPMVNGVTPAKEKDKEKTSSGGDAALGKAVKNKANGATQAEGGMISPESLEAS